MRKLLSTKYSAGAFNTAMLALRLGIGILMINHGFQKLTHFNETVNNMPSLLGMGNRVSAVLIIFAEFFCSLFIIMGLFTRLSSIPLIIAMLVALFKVHNGDTFGNGETVCLYLAGYLVLLIVGPGKVSVDGMMGK
jgi:putative oxidoreductase